MASFLPPLVQPFYLAPPIRLNLDSDPMQPGEAESVTRRQRIDPKLAAAGWRVTAPTSLQRAATLSASAVTELETADGPADYALCDDHRIQAVVGAKKLSLGPQGVLVQAERYSRGTDQEPEYPGGVNNVNTDEVRGLMIPVPPLPEQREIVNLSAKVLSVASDCGTRISRAGRAIERMAPAILAKIVNGEVGTTNGVRGTP